MTFLLAVLLYKVGGWKWIIPILTFFLSSSLLSRFRRKEKDDFAELFEKSSKRDAAQVLANGALAGLLVVVWSTLRADWVYVAYLGTVAAVTSDTWSTEIGILSRAKPRSIISFKQVASGTSGAFTILGIGAGISGSALIFLAGAPWLDSTGSSVASTFQAFLVILVAGTVGNLVDSILGGSLQAQYRCRVCGLTTERKLHCGASLSELARGKRWVTNDTVNFVCSAVGGGIAFAALNLL